MCFCLRLRDVFANQLFEAGVRQMPCVRVSKVVEMCTCATIVAIAATSVDAGGPTLPRSDGRKLPLQHSQAVRQLEENQKEM